MTDPIILDSTEYTEGVQFPRTIMGESNTIRFEIKNPYPNRVVIEHSVNDEDVEIVFCPQTLGGYETGVCEAKYSPKSTRKESLNGKEIEFRIVL